MRFLSVLIGLLLVLPVQAHHASAVIGVQGYHSSFALFSPFVSTVRVFGYAYPQALAAPVYGACGAGIGAYGAYGAYGACMPPPPPPAPPVQAPLPPAPQVQAPPAYVPPVSYYAPLLAAPVYGGYGFGHVASVFAVRHVHAAVVVRQRNVVVVQRPAQQVNVNVKVVAQKGKKGRRRR